MNLRSKYFSPGDNLKTALTSNGNYLLWNDSIGLGYLKSNGYVYDSQYWESYQRYSDGVIGDKLTTFRESFVKQYLSDVSNICDVGIGSGQFVDRINCKGYDVNPIANRWLLDRDAYADPYHEKFEALTFWDVLEHIDDPSEILENTKKVFVSLPIHDSFESCLRSKHLKPDEHIWHFTQRGIEFFMLYHGFVMINNGDEGESKIGRESIRSYFFQKPDK